MEHRIPKFILKFFMTSVMMAAGIAASAQNAFTVSTKLVDAKTEEPVGFATASLTVKGEKAPLKYVLADSDGKAVLQKVRKGTYVFKAELLGYVTYEQEIKIEGNLDLVPYLILLKFTDLILSPDIHAYLRREIAFLIFEDELLLGPVASCRGA